jgi:hypothetical protein
MASQSVAQSRPCTTDYSQAELIRTARWAIKRVMCWTCGAEVRGSYVGVTVRVGGECPSLLVRFHCPAGHEQITHVAI